MNTGIHPDSKIKDLEFTARTTNALRNAGIFTVGQLVSLPYIKVITTTGIGKKGTNDIRDVLSAHGLYLRGEWNSARGFEEFMSKQAPASDSPKMASIETGGPAFPVTPTDRSGQIADTEMGMTLRDYFAAKAMQAIIASDGTYEYKNRAIEAYQAADAMLEARGK